MHFRKLDGVSLTEMITLPNNSQLRNKDSSSHVPAVTGGIDSDGRISPSTVQDVYEHDEVEY